MKKSGPGWKATKKSNVGMKRTPNPSSDTNVLEEEPLTEYERKRMTNIMQNNRIFRSLGLQAAKTLIQSARGIPSAASREDSDSLYEPGDGEDIEQGVANKDDMLDLEPELPSTLRHNVYTGRTLKSKRVMATQEEDRPTRLTRQRTREMPSPPEENVESAIGVENDSSQDALLPVNADLQSNEDCPNKRHVGRGLDRMSKGLNAKIPIHIAEGNLRPEAPIQAAKLAAEAGIILRDNIPVLPRWKDYKDDEGLVQNYVGKIASQFTMDTTSKAVNAACCDLLKKGQRQLRYYLKKKYFNGIPTDKVRTTSPVSTMSDLQWKKLVEMWSTARHKERCLKNKESREKVRLQQTTGSRCYVAQLFVARQTKYKDSPPTAIDHFKDTHCSSKTGFSENAKNAINEMEAIVGEPQDGENPKTAIEAVVQ